MFCKNCGKQVYENASFCPNCGARIERIPAPAYQVQQRRNPTTLQTVAYVFMIIATVVYAFFLIPLAWMIPMTVVYKKKIDAGIPVGVGFKVCTLLFVNLIAGILMLCDDDTP